MQGIIKVHLQSLSWLLAFTIVLIYTMLSLLARAFGPLHSPQAGKRVYRKPLTSEYDAISVFKYVNKLILLLYQQTTSCFLQYKRNLSFDYRSSLNSNARGWRRPNKSMAHVKVYSRWIHSQLNCGKLLTINLSVKSFLSPLLTFPFGISNNAHTDRYWKLWCEGTGRSTNTHQTSVNIVMISTAN